MIFEVFDMDSKYYKEMMDIIISSKVNPPEKGHLHHIIPRCWFKHFRLEVDNSMANTVLLSYENHKKVHNLAYKCAKEKWLKSKLACACHYLGLSGEYEYIVSAETRKKMSESQKGRTAWNKGKHLSVETRKKMSLVKKGEKNNMFGKTHSDETKQKIRETMLSKTSNRKGKLFSEF